MGEFAAGYVRARYVGRRWCILARVCATAAKGYSIRRGAGANGTTVHVANGAGANERNGGGIRQRTTDAD